MKTLVVDGEFNGLTPTRMWCLVAKDVDTGERTVLRYDEPAFWYKVKALLKTADIIVGHMMLEYDSKWINFLADKKLIDTDKVHDTLVMSRLINAGKYGGHSVENWAKSLDLSIRKVAVGDDEWDNPGKIDLYVERCAIDVDIQVEIYKYLRRFFDDPAWGPAYRCEHEFSLVCLDMHENGFSFDGEKADVLLKQITDEMAPITAQLQGEIPRKLVRRPPIKLRVTRTGLPYATVDRAVGVPLYALGTGDWYPIEYVPFNPGSAKDRVEFLNSVGWKPFNKTKGHLKQERIVNAIRRRGKRADKAELAKQEARLAEYRRMGWKVDEDNLDTLPSDAPPSASLLAAWLTLDGRRGDLVEWLEAYIPRTQRVYPRIKHIGAWTHRSSHSAPNCGNIFSTFGVGDIRGDSPTAVEAVKLRYDAAARSCWRAEPGWTQVGVDAKGIQLRVLAHYLEDEEYGKRVCFGREEDGTDVHSYHRDVLGPICASRRNAKTFIYAWLLGAGDGQVAVIFQSTVPAAREAASGFVDRVPGLRHLKYGLIPEDARRGYFDGLDGRKVKCDSDHLMLAGYLQNGEAVIMKHANLKWRKWAKEDGLVYRQLNFVHDEWQSECPTYEEAEYLGSLKTKALEETGKDLDLFVPIEGSVKLGRNWMECH